MPKSKSESAFVPGTDLAPKFSKAKLFLVFAPLVVLTFTDPSFHDRFLSRQTRLVGISAVFIASLLVTVVKVIGNLVDRRKRLAQDVRYHNFADKRALCMCGVKVPNAADVLSNIPFFLFGAAGIVASLAHRFGTENERLPYVLFFVGITLVGFGSAWYHWKPQQQPGVGPPADDHRVPGVL
jgi:hypothetical protein